MRCYLCNPFFPICQKLFQFVFDGCRYLLFQTNIFHFESFLFPGKWCKSNYRGIFLDTDTRASLLHSVLLLVWNCPVVEYDKRRLFCFPRYESLWGDDVLGNSCLVTRLGPRVGNILGISKCNDHNLFPPDMFVSGDAAERIVSHRTRFFSTASSLSCQNKTIEICVITQHYLTPLIMCNMWHITTICHLKLYPKLFISAPFLFLYIIPPSVQCILLFVVFFLSHYSVISKLWTQRALH